MDHKQVSDTWERGSPYEQYVGRWSRRVAPLFLSWLSIPAGRSGSTWDAAHDGRIKARDESRAHLRRYAQKGEVP